MEKVNQNTEQNTESGKAKRLKNLKLWKKGDKSPNPKGHPKGLRNFETIYKEALVMLAKENNETPEEFENKMIAKGILMSRKGQYQFYKDTIDRLHGQATQKVETETTLKVEKLDEIQKVTKALLNG